MALDYDFWLRSGETDLGFNTAITKERPYERATAQFRKDQADTTATVGDQSLTGWWTRGQLSFHKGAGVKYYEVLGNSADSAENRLHDAIGVDPWEPGEVTLADELTAVTLTGITDIVRTQYVGFGDGITILKSDGTMRVRLDGTLSTQAKPTWAGTDDIISMSSIRGFPFLATEASLGVVPVTDAMWDAPAGANWVNLWCLKDRVFAYADNGEWYALGIHEDPTKVAGVDADPFWTYVLTNDPYGSDWAAAEGPAAVYLTHGNTIYGVTLDSEGLVPTVAFAGVAAQLPEGEVVSTIEYYLGWLLICTNIGVRAALVGADGALVLGPRIVEGDFSARACIGTTGDCAYVTGVLDGETDGSLIEINLTETVTELTPVWSRRLDDLDASGPMGAVQGGDALYVFDADGFRYVGGTLEPTGTLTTGFHRLGTLEPKAFRLLRVKTEGTEGDIDVTVNTPGGTTYTVGTVAAGDTEEFDLASVADFPSSLEYLSITFTLNRGTTTGPTLLGYQLKALPVPKRQRMIRVPLMLMDSETNRRRQTIAHRRPGVTDPWTRLAALEDLEESNAVVSFEDKLTGETGSAYIESVEVTRTSNDDFGGFVFVTLRVV